MVHQTSDRIPFFFGDHTWQRGGSDRSDGIKYATIVVGLVDRIRYRRTQWVLLVLVGQGCILYNNNINLVLYTLVVGMQFQFLLYDSYMHCAIGSRRTGVADIKLFAICGRIRVKVANLQFYRFPDFHLELKHARILLEIHIIVINVN